MDSYYGDDGRRGTDGTLAKRKSEEIEQKTMSEHFYNKGEDEIDQL